MRRGLTRPSSSVAGEGGAGSLHTDSWQLAHSQPDMQASRAGEASASPETLPSPCVWLSSLQLAAGPQWSLWREAGRLWVGWSCPLRAGWMWVLA